MKTYDTGNKWKSRVVFVVATIAIGAGVLELVAGAMKFPDPDTMAVRQQVLAVQAERAQQIRELQKGEVRYATSGTSVDR